MNGKTDVSLNRTAFGRAYRDGYPTTIRFLMARGMGVGEAQEAAQAGWARAWERRESLRDPGRLLAWVSVISMNIYRRSFMRAKTHVPLDPSSHGAKVSAKASEVRAELAWALECCSPEERRLLRESYILGLTSEEMASESGSSAVTVRVRLMRARRKVRKVAQRRDAGNGGDR